MKEVIKYESFDGGLFDTEKQCTEHELFAGLCRKLEEEVYLRQDADSSEIINWIKNNKDLVLEYIL